MALPTVHHHGQGGSGGPRSAPQRGYGLCDREELTHFRVANAIRIRTEDLVAFTEGRKKGTSRHRDVEGTAGDSSQAVAGTVSV